MCGLFHCYPDNISGSSLFGRGRKSCSTGRTGHHDIGSASLEGFRTVVSIPAA